MTPTKPLVLALAAALVPSIAFAQPPEEQPTMEAATMAAPTMEAAAMEAAPTMAAAMEAAPTMAAPMQAATMEAPSAMTGPTAAQLAERRERIRANREAREAAAAAAEAAAAAAAAEAAAVAEAAAEETTVESPEIAPSADEVALEASEAELEAMAAEENLEGEDFAEEEALDPAEEDADLLAAIEDTEFEDAHEALHGGGHGDVTWGAIFSDRGWQAALITFTCLVLLFWFFLFKKGRAVPKALEARRREIEEHLAEAQRLKAEAEAKKAEYAERLEALDSQLESLRGEMVRAGEQERDRIVAEAESKAASIRKDVEFTIQQRMKQLREDLTGEMARAAVAAAEEVLREQTKPADQQRLADEYLKSLADAAGSKETQA